MEQLKNLDRISLTAVCVVLPFIVALVIYFIRIVIQAVRGKREFKKRGAGFLGVMAVSVVILVIFRLCVDKMYLVIEHFVPAEYLRSCTQQNLDIAAGFFMLPAVLGVLCCWGNYLFPKPEEKAVFRLILLAAVSGLGNMLIISIVNTAVGGADNFLRSNLFYFFLLGLSVYLVSQKLLRTNFIKLANNIIYKKRVEMTEKILNTSFRKFEEIDTGRIYAGLNNDTEMISECANIIILGVTASTTILCCFIYLSFVYFRGLMISLGVILTAAFFYYQAGKKSRMLWNQSRDIQNRFFQFISDLTHGFKELAIHKDKKQEFKKDMFAQCKLYKEKRIEAFVRFANVFVLGEFLFNAVIGSVVFVLPLVFSDVTNQVLLSFVIIFLYMSSPVYTLLNLIPNLIQVKISWDRINGLILELNKMAEEDKAQSDKIEGSLILEAKDLYFEYQDEKERSFCVGPIDYRFRSGEIIFITGGNGSGKSTLAKLLTGLYPPTSGELLMNGQKMEPDELGKYFSAIFSDSFLFDKLYGIDTEAEKQIIDRYLKVLKMDHKVKVEDGAFSRTRLSTGQKKRLALLVSFLEDRQIYLFDEWAADQDPEFRKFFYHTLIHQLKEKGKCVIAITHDDHYFGLADKVIKMNMGKISDEKQ